MIPGKAVLVTVHFLLKRQKAVFAQALTDYSAIILSGSSFIRSLGALTSPCDMLCCIQTKNHDIVLKQGCAVFEKQTCHNLGIFELNGLNISHHFITQKKC